IKQLPVADFAGKEMIIEYFEPLDAEFAGELVVGAVTQAYADLQVKGMSRIGINCPQGDDWQIQKHSVCLMTFHDWRYSFICTGALINNVKQDQTPYFLTANHCIRSEYVANSLVTYFNFENSACDVYDASDQYTLAGATLKAGNGYSDFSLLLLSETPPEEYNAYYAGWDIRGNGPQNGVIIHHPNGQPKCIAVRRNPIVSYPEKIQWTSDGLRLYSTTLPNTHWGVEFDEGEPEVGSSGSPLFDQNKRIVGQLHGGANFVLLFGKLSLSWNYYSEPEKQLAYWLDPDTTTQVLDGIWKIPPKANFTSQLQQVCPNTPVLFFDKTTQKPISWRWKVSPSSYSFANGTDSTSQHPQIVFMKEGRYSVSLQTSNIYGSDEVTVQNFILAREQLDVKLLRLPNDNVVCGCDLKSFPLVAGGAVDYDFKIDKPGIIDIQSKADTVYMTMKDFVNITHSFDTWVKVTGTNGTCMATDSMLVHVVVQPNDQIANAAPLQLGRNAGFSSHCATVENNEPHPWATGCTAPDSWCPNLSGEYNVLDNSIWFKFRSPSHGGITISTNGYDSQIAVYEASVNEYPSSGKKIQYNLLSANDNRSISDFTAQIENLMLVPGKEYLLQVDGNNAAYGDLVIDLISNSLEVWPNPSSGKINVVVSNPGQGIADVVISDLNGKRLFERKYNVNLSNNSFSADLSGFAKGLYVLSVRINGSQHSKKLVIW
ncbi:MAG TPA: T9SS type A sorting domain-containing protein, partial [Prolixibacteraceae bacterium]|nr:T9SS type A sorting domain-containing protein [Prolixibacteraceae bacterium]